MTENSDPQTCFVRLKKVRLVFGHSKRPMEVRETFKNYLRVQIMFTSELAPRFKIGPRQTAIAVVAVRGRDGDREKCT